MTKTAALPPAAAGGSEPAGYLFVAANDANSSRVATISISGLPQPSDGKPALRAVEAVPCVLDQQGDFEAQTMDTAKLVNMTVALAAFGDGGASFAVELEGDSTLTVRLALKTSDIDASPRPIALWLEMSRMRGLKLSTAGAP